MNTGQVRYNSPNRLCAGRGAPVRVNLSFGAAVLDADYRERRKMERLLNGPGRPDMLMDLSVVPLQKELWQSVRPQFAGPIGLLPHYVLFSERSGLDVKTLLTRINDVVRNGINFITIHGSPTRELIELARIKRQTPVTSRGGGIVIQDMHINQRRDNIFRLAFRDILDICAETGAVLNLGTTFRAASVWDGYDLVLKAELQSQAELIEAAKARGVHVVLEGPGHIRASQIHQYFASVSNFEVPLMPLGPIVTDVYPDGDHIASAIGAAMLMSLSHGGVINAVTPVEHLGGVPNLQQTRTGLTAALVAAQVASGTYCSEALELEQQVAFERAGAQSCVVGSPEPGCKRCSHVCPLVRDYSRLIVDDQ
jgi:phosphomethylpyrimidine synthase